MLGIVVYTVVVLSMTAMLVVVMRDNERLHEEKSEMMRAYADLASRHVRAMREMPANEHAKMLGRTVEARTSDGAKWREMVVVAVSWKGALAVRPTSEPDKPARWIHKSKVDEWVR